MAKVLYVEDHEAQRDIMVQMLELYGYKVDVACDGEEGMKKAQEWHPDVILMDVRMPGRIDGIVATRELRNISETADIPIIVISAWGSTAHKERALKAGADAHFTKPVPMDELIAAINRYAESEQPRRRRKDRTKKSAKKGRIKKDKPSQDTLAASLKAPVKKPRSSAHKDRLSQDTLAALGRAFASTEHDLVGMLSNIQSTVELMMSSAPKPEQVKRIWRASRHCLLMVEFCRVASRRGSGA